MNVYRKNLNDLNEELKSEMPTRRRNLLMSVRKKLELWAPMEEGDIDALMELSINHGTAQRETWERVKKECQQHEVDYDEEEI